MKIRAISIVRWLLVVILILTAGIWLVLATPLFSNMRISVVENVLSQQIGQPLYVRKDVSVVLAPISRVYVSGVEIPSENMTETNVAEMKVLEFNVNLVDLIRGNLNLDNLKLDGLQINLITQEDGTTSWSPETDAVEIKKPEETAAADIATSDDKQPENGILDFLKKRTAVFTSVGLTTDNRKTGFQFEFLLENLNLDQLKDKLGLAVQSKGTVNGQLFTIKGNYPQGSPFTTQVEFGDVDLSFNGSPVPSKKGGGFKGKLALNTGEIGDILDVLRLTRTFEGLGTLNADLISHTGVLAVDNLAVDIQLHEGQQLTAQGSVSNILRTEGYDVEIKARLHPKGAPPSRAKELKDLKLTGLSTKIVSEDENTEFKELLLETNAFDRSLQEVGPITIGRIRRTSDGHLAMENIDLQAGPRGEPYIVAEGNIHNLLQLKDLNSEGTLNAPAKLLLHELGDDVAAAFGGIQAKFQIDDSQGHLSLNSLDGYTVDTEIWSLTTQLQVTDVNSLEGLDFSFDLDIADGAEFLGALKLEEIDAGAIEIRASAKNKGKELLTGLGLSAGGSVLDISLNSTFPVTGPKVRGQMFSESINLNDITNAVASIVQLAKLSDNSNGEKTPTESNVQPLVLPKEEESEPDQSASEVEVQPLVVPKEDKKPVDLLSLEDLLTKTDLNVAIDIQEIKGQQGVSSIASELTAMEGKAEFGPLELAYGGGHFNVSAKMDLVESPEILSVSGSTAGWDLGKILDSIGLGIQAHGKLRATFNIAGNRSSAKTFINSMYGNATISMSQGNVASSLLELAGLGVLPWLFSKELGQGYTDIVCLVAPIKINAGKLSSQSIVVETKSVQLVAAGSLDWRKDTISLRAEPRRVGRPLARSAWPFDVTGKLSSPQFTLDVGGSRPKGLFEKREMPANRKPCKPDIRQLR